MKNKWKTILGYSRVLTIMFAMLLANALYKDTDDLIVAKLVSVGLGGTSLFAILWILSKIKVENIIMEEQRIKKEEQKKIEEEKKKQQYEEISDIWEYGEKAVLAVSQPLSEEILGRIHYIKLKYTNINSNPWIITINTPTGFSEDFKAKRKNNTLVGLKDDKIAIMKEGQLTINDEIFYFSTENKSVKTVSGLMEELLNGKKFETIRDEHFKAASEDIIDALPKFHFTFTEKGIMCDEINYPQKHLEDFFKKNNGKEHIFQNKIFYMDYCRNHGLFHFDVFQEKEFKEYMRKMGMQAIKSGYSCNTNFELSEWQVSIKHGVERLFRSIKSYVDKKTLDVVPIAFGNNTIYFQHKHYSPKNNETMLFHNLAIVSMEEEREGKEPVYVISKTDSGIIHINIDGEVFVGVQK